MQLNGIHHLTAVTADAPRQPCASTPACWACGWSRRPSTRTTSAPTTCSMPTARARPARTSPSSTGRRRRAPRHPHDRPHRPARQLGAAPSSGGRSASMRTGVQTAEIAERDGRSTLDFEDPEGQRLAWSTTAAPAMLIRGRRARCRRSIRFAGSDRSPSSVPDLGRPTRC